MRHAIFAVALVLLPLAAHAQLSDNQRTVLKDYVQRTDPDTLVAFIESTRQQQVAIIRAYASTRRAELQAQRDSVAATLTEAEAQQAERDAEIAKYDDVKQ